MLSHNNFSEIPNFRHLSITKKNFKIRNDGQIAFLHFGQIGKSYRRNIDFLAPAILRLCRQNIHTNFIFDFYGNLERSERDSLSSITAANLSVRFLDPVDISNLPRAYDIGLLLGVAGNPGYVSSKFFSYLELNIPIFAAAKGNLVEKYIDEYNVGCVSCFDDDFLLDCYLQSKGMTFYTKNLEYFSQAKQHENFCKIIF